MLPSREKNDKTRKRNVEGKGVNRWRVTESQEAAKAWIRVMGPAGTPSSFCWGGRHHQEGRPPVRCRGQRSLLAGACVPGRDSRALDTQG